MPHASADIAEWLLKLPHSTKHRQSWIPDDVGPALQAYQAGIFKQWESPAIAIGGTEDHVHALFSLSKNHALKKIVEEVKKGSSKWMKAEGSKNENFYWQSGYAAFSVSQSNVDAVRRYIETQKERHRRMTFQDELRELFRRHGVEFDERYVWDTCGISVGLVCFALSGHRFLDSPTQGGAGGCRRGALPWADLLRPLRGEEAHAWRRPFELK